MPGNPLPINYGPIEINNNAPSDKEIWLAPASFQTAERLVLLECVPSKSKTGSGAYNGRKTPKAKELLAMGIIGDSLPIWSKQP